MSRSQFLVAAGLAGLAAVFVGILATQGISQDPMPKNATSPVAPGFPGAGAGPATTFPAAGAAPGDLGTGFGAQTAPSEPPSTSRFGPVAPPTPPGNAPLGVGFAPPGAPPTTGTSPAAGAGPASGGSGVPPTRPFAGFGGFGASGGGGADESLQFRVLYLKNGSAESVREILRTLLPKTAETTAIDARTNSLIIRAPDGLFNQIEELVKFLDQDLTKPPTGKRPMVPGVGAPTGGGGTAAPMVGPGAGAAGTMPAGPGMSQGLQMMMGGGSLSAVDLKRQYEAADQAARDLAASIQKNGSDAARQAELRQRVAAAFATRQRLLRAEMVELQRRLTTMQESVDLRDRVSEQIIDRRTAELTNPGLTWEPRAESTPAGRRPTSFGGMSGGFSSVEVLLEGDEAGVNNRFGSGGLSAPSDGSSLPGKAPTTAAPASRTPKSRVIRETTPTNAAPRKTAPSLDNVPLNEKGPASGTVPTSPRPERIPATGVLPPQPGKVPATPSGLGTELPGKGDTNAAPQVGPGELPDQLPALPDPDRSDKEELPKLNSNSDDPPSADEVVTKP